MRERVRKIKLLVWQQSVRVLPPKNRRLLESLFLNNIVWGTYVKYLVKIYYLAHLMFAYSLKKNDLNIKKNEIKIAVIPGLSKIIYDYSTLCNTQ